MNTLSRDAYLVQNPALGAVLIWRFACGYRRHHPHADVAPLPLGFVVLPLVLHVDSFELLEGTRSNLRGFADKFAQSSDPGADKALAVHDRVASWRAMSLHAVRLAVRSRLVVIDRSRGTLVPLSEAKPTSAVPASVRPLLGAAEKLGRWFAELTVYEVASILKVTF